MLDEDKLKSSFNILLQVLKKEDFKPFLDLKDFISGGITAIMPTSLAVEEYQIDIESGRKFLGPGMGRALDENSSSEVIGAVALAFQNFNKTKNRINFLPERFRKKPSRLPFAFFLSLLCLFFIALTVMGASYYIHGRIQNKQLDTRFAYLKNQVKKVEKLETRIEILEKRSNEIKHIMGAGSPVLDILKEMTRILPAHTYLKEFEFKKQVVRIKGSSKNASRLIEPLETSLLFSETGFESKITIKENNQESFIIKMKYEPENKR